MSSGRTDEDYMMMAIEKATRGIHQGQTPFGACIVRNGKVLSCEHNTVWEETDITSHAEIKAIRTACQKYQTVDLKGSTIYSTCEPCPMCFSACHWAGIAKIVYGADINDAKNAGFNELLLTNQMIKSVSKSEIVIIKDVLKEKCVELFHLWLNQDMKRAY